MTRLWVRIIKHHRIAAQAEAPCAWGEEKTVLPEILKGLDEPLPIWLTKHENEFARFRQTAFLPDHFIEQIDFDKMEIEFIDDDAKKKKKSNPLYE